MSAFMVDTVVERSTRSMLDPLEPVVRRLLEECPEIKAPRVTEILRADYGYEGSVDLVVSPDASTPRSDRTPSYQDPVTPSSAARQDRPPDTPQVYGDAVRGLDDCARTRTLTPRARRSLPKGRSSVRWAWSSETSAP
ncbi:MAG TPA: hypothetical protein VI006_08500, partial [Solirubrobacteraceae bacterium]